jgi:hypothetical protein
MRLEVVDVVVDALADLFFAERQNPPLIPSDPIAPGLDFDAFARRAGEIIARAARAARKGHRQPD